MKNKKLTIALLVACLSAGGFIPFAHAKWYRCYFSACKQIESGTRPDQCRVEDQEIITYYQNSLWLSNERDPHVLGRQQVLNDAIESGKLIQQNDGRYTVTYYDRPHRIQTAKQAIVQDILCQWPWDDLPNVKRTQLEGVVKLIAQSDCSGITDLKQGESAEVYTIKLIPIINSTLHELELTISPNEKTARVVTVRPMHLEFVNDGQKADLKAIYDTVTDQNSNIKIGCQQSSSYISHISIGVL